MKSRKAFTLIELLIVIAIIGILAAGIFVSLNAARKKAYDAQVKSDMTSLSQALEIVKIDRTLTTLSWSTLADIPSTVTSSNDANIARWTDSGDATTGNRLVPKLPTDPNGGVYGIHIIAGNSYSMVGALSVANKFYCIKDGQSKEITATATAADATTNPPTPATTNLQNAHTACDS